MSGQVRALKIKWVALLLEVSNIAAYRWAYGTPHKKKLIFAIIRKEVKVIKKIRVCDTTIARLVDGKMITSTILTPYTKTARKFREDIERNVGEQVIILEKSAPYMMEVELVENTKEQ